MENVFLYGFGGAEDNLRLVQWMQVEISADIVDDILLHANVMKSMRPEITEVWVVSRQRGLAKYAQAALHDGGDFRTSVEFKDYIERRGIRVL